MPAPVSLNISPFSPADQPAVKTLILAGLEEHWGAIDLDLNPDLGDIAASYKNAVFLVARIGEEIVGCGALKTQGKFKRPAVSEKSSTTGEAGFSRKTHSLEKPGACENDLSKIPEAIETGEIVRMSVAKIHRRRGIGNAILDALCAAARERGLKGLVLETTASWTDARAFYEANGFVYTHFVDDEFGGQAHYSLEI